MTILNLKEYERLRAENAKLLELLRGVGANRYWEGRWRDADAENAKLRAALKGLFLAVLHDADTYREELLEAKAVLDEQKP